MCRLFNRRRYASVNANHDLDYDVDPPSETWNDPWTLTCCVMRHAFSVTLKHRASHRDVESSNVLDFLPSVSANVSSFVNGISRHDFGFLNGCEICGVHGDDNL